MKILLIAIGTRGDVQPFVVLGRALMARGHDVALAAPQNFADMIGRAGVSHLPLPVDYQALMNDPDTQAAMSSLRGKLRMFRAASDMMNAQLSALWTQGMQAAPTLILYHFKGALAPYLARALGGVAVPVMLQPGFAVTAQYPQFLISSRSLGRVGNRLSHQVIQGVMRAGTGVMLRRWRRASGTDIGPPMDPLDGWNGRGARLRIHAYSPSITARPSDWSDRECQTGYLFGDPAAFAPPRALANFLTQGPPPIYIGFGSMPGTHATRAGQAVIGALHKTGQRAVISTGWGGLRDLAQSAQIHVVDAVPHDWLFPQMASVVHHGGSGTTHEGLRWGRPSVICPLFADQPFFGAQVAALGVGPDPIPQKRLSADRLAHALTQTQDGAMVARAGEIGAQIRGEDGIGQVCDLVDRLTGSDGDKRLGC